MGQGIILMVISIQKWDTGLKGGGGGILNFESWYFGYGDKFKFQTVQ